MHNAVTFTTILICCIIPVSCRQSTGSIFRHAYSVSDGAESCVTGDTIHRKRRVAAATDPAEW